MKTTILILSLLLVTITSCNQDQEETYNPTLPEATQTGENTFGCKINGQIMVPRDSRTSQLGGAPTGVSYSRNRTLNKHYDWVESIDRYRTNRGGIAFKLPNIDTLGVGEYIIKHVDGAFSVFNPNIAYMGAISKNGFYSSIEDTGKIIITRYDDNVISGTFYCTLKNDYEPNDIIEVTEGRFDFNRNTINTTKFP